MSAAVSLEGLKYNSYICWWIFHLYNTNFYKFVRYAVRVNEIGQRRTLVYSVGAWFCSYIMAQKGRTIFNPDDFIQLVHIFEIQNI